MPSDIQFKQVRRLLEAHGWVLSRIHGSHHIFTKPEAQTVSIPVHHRKVKAIYVKQIEKLIADEKEQA
ncbi:MAG: type II toxin-antitoxin system HicA family toxin, partial [Rhodospirillales bacterium]|nr:type II toxin-antitoxin system HicA family toxin [Rhodospirillales bacterium]